MSPGGAGPPCPPAAAAVCFYFDITLVGGAGGGGSAPGRGGGQECARGSRPASLVQPLAAGGRWALRAPLSTCLHSSPLPPWQGRTRWDALKKASGLSSETLPPGPPETWSHALTHARTQMPAPPSPIHLQSHGRTYIRAHALAHAAWMDILRQEVWVTPTCTHANVA